MRLENEVAAVGRFHFRLTIYRVHRRCMAEKVHFRKSSVVPVSPITFCRSSLNFPSYRYSAECGQQLLHATGFSLRMNFESDKLDNGLLFIGFNQDHGKSA